MPNPLYSSPYNTVVAELNAGEGIWAGAVTDELYAPEAIREAILTAEGEMIAAFLTAWSHGRRFLDAVAGRQLLRVATVADGGVIPSHIGGVTAVIVNGHVCEPVSLASLMDLKADNILKLRTISHLYALTGDNRLYFTGTGSASVHHTWYEKPSFADMNAFLAGEMLAPPELERPIIDRAMARILPREGEMMGVSQSYFIRSEITRREILGQNVPQSMLESAQRNAQIAE